MSQNKWVIFFDIHDKFTIFSSTLMAENKHDPNDGMKSVQSDFDGKSFRFIFDHNPLPMYIFRLTDFCIINVNRAMVESYGYSESELLAMTIMDIRPEEDIGDLRRFFELQGQAFNHHQEWRHRKKNGETFWVEIDSYKIEYAGQPCRIVFARDITKRKHAEQDIFSDREFAERINHTIPDVLYIFDVVERKNVFCNRNILMQSGYTPEEIKGMGGQVIEKVIHPEDYPRFRRYQDLYPGLKDGDVIEIEYRMRLKDGGVHWFRSAEAVFKRNASGHVIQVIGLCKDITERKFAEDQLKSSEEFFKSTFDGVDTLLTVLEIADDGRFYFVTFNEAMRNKIGENRAREKINQPIDTCIDDLGPELMSRVESLCKDCIKTGQTHEEDIEYAHNDGTLEWWHLRVSPVRNAQNQSTRLIVFLHAISDKKRREEEDSRNQRLESVGLLAGGIAHDFNNFLVTVMMNASLMKRDNSFSEKYGQYIDDILKVCEEAQQLTKQLLTFARGGAPLKEVTDLGELLQDASRFALRGTQIACTYDISADLLKVDIDPGQIRQVIYNLVLNARQVLGDGGKIEITAWNEDFRGEASRIPENFVSFSITDNGQGIHVDDQKNIFEPYFSTKKTGTGLGLAVSHSIISKHGGSIEFSSIPGQGTTFSVTLPAVIGQEPLPKKITSEVMSGHGLLILMDDNEMILNTLEETVILLGYEAVKSSEGEECVRLFEALRAQGKKVDAFILDLTIQGGVGGVETLRRLKEIDQNVKAIASSGYSEQDIMTSFSKLGFCAVLPKPYRLSDLSQVLCEVINKPS